jgi:uncharacterized protein YdaU (DUF1376 family)
MKPDAYMPMFWNEFWQAVEGLDDRIIVAYLRALSHYWHHTNAGGIDDDDDKLRRLCRQDKDDWPVVRIAIFSRGGFFHLDHGRWHSKRAKEEWNKSQMRYDSSVNGGKNRWKGISAKEHSSMSERAADARWHTR